jgi:hypothetical protein
MGADCKSAGYAYVGSNPTRPKSENIVCKSVNVKKNKIRKVKKIFFFKRRKIGLLVNF